MRILVTGSEGYIGSVLMPLACAQGHDAVGLDAGWFSQCTFGPATGRQSFICADVRDLRSSDLRGFDAVVHLAALSNDPLGSLDPQLTFEINYKATVRLARLAKEAGVVRFVFSSSCSSYGAAGNALLDENASCAPVTPYGRSKVLAERKLAALADDRFTPVILRNATAYGPSPRLRLDLVLNDFAASAATSGHIVIRSDGSPWRPVVHVEDICRAFLAVLDAPQAAVHNQAFNVGRTEENYRVRELAEMVRRTVPGCRVEYARGGGPDKRCYRVDCGKILRRVPGFVPHWTVPDGVRQLHEAYYDAGFVDADLQSPRYVRLKTLQGLLAEGHVDTALRWSDRSEPVGAVV
ncbi:MAG: SDR family oxidoreductase [Thermoguttaceae bacterium]|jgi:nucleoside-diphosphate-sugar epimerase|nr:SDR family oxidoreductase [Thermoguttaceae bacterium]